MIMVKKLVLLLSILTLSLPSFSQTATQVTIDTQNIVLPVRVAKQIVKDLIRKDSCVTQLNLANSHIIELETKTVLQDSIISQYKQKEQNYILLVDSEKKKNEIFQDELKKAQKEIKKLKAKRTFGRIISIALFGTLTYLYIVK